MVSQLMVLCTYMGDDHMYYRIVNGEKTEIPADEIAAMEEVQKAHEAAERARPLNAEEVTRLLIKKQINTLEVDDQTALRMRRYYPTFAELVGQTVKLGTKFRADDSENADLYKTIQPELTIQASWAK